MQTSSKICKLYLLSCKRPHESSRLGGALVLKFGNIGFMTVANCKKKFFPDLPGTLLSYVGCLSYKLYRLFQTQHSFSVTFFTPGFRLSFILLQINLQVIMDTRRSNIKPSTTHSLVRLWLVRLSTTFGSLQKSPTRNSLIP